MMLLLLLGLLVGIPCAFAGDSGNHPGSANVNSRYTVESVEFKPEGPWKLSTSLRERIRGFVGARFDQNLLDDLVTRLRRELRDRPVSARLERGSSPDHVRVTLHVEVSDREFQADLSKLVYHSKQNFSFGLDLSYRQENQAVHFGALTDNDQLLERYSGVRGGYERTGLAGGRVNLGVEASVFRSQWNGATLGPAQAAGVTAYRERLELEPTATVKLLRPLTLQLGVSLGRLEPNLPAARNEISSAAIGTLRFQRRWGLSSDRQHRIELAYGLRSGTSALASQYSFTRHSWTGRYSFRGRHEELIASFQGGLLSGRAPLFERFLIGNSAMLRGWNKFDLAPLGAGRIAAGSLDYRWRKLRLVYDAGALWSSGLNPSADGKLRQSAAVGLAENRLGGFSLLLAFPLREGRMEPILIAGMNF